MAVRVSIVAFLFAVASTSAGAQAAYTVATNSSVSSGQGVLYRINLTQHTATQVGVAGNLLSAPVEQMAGLTYSLDGKLYATALLGNLAQPYLVNVNPINGTASAIGPLGDISQGDQGSANLAFTCDNKLWLVSANSNRLWEVDPTSGATRLVGQFNTTISGLATRGNVVYGTGGVGAGPLSLYTVDMAAATATAVGPYGNTSWVSLMSPAFDANGQLWSVIASYPQPNNGGPLQWNTLAQISSTSGALVPLGDITGLDNLKGAAMSGMAIAPPVCGDFITVPPTAVRPAPTLSSTAIWLLVLSIGSVAIGVLRARIRF